MNFINLFKNKNFIFNKTLKRGFSKQFDFFFNLNPLISKKNKKL